MMPMSLGNDFEKQSKRTHKHEFLDEIELVVPWRDLVAIIEPHSPPKATGRPAFAMENMLRIHLLQQWFNLSEPAMEEALYDTPCVCQLRQTGSGHYHHAR
jgi:IS5 family transposase